MRKVGEREGLGERGRRGRREKRKKKGSDEEGETRRE